MGLGTDGPGALEDVVQTAPSCLPGRGRFVIESATIVLYGKDQFCLADRQAHFKGVGVSVPDNVVNRLYSDAIECHLGEFGQRLVIDDIVSDEMKIGAVLVDADFVEVRFKC